jgi:hypothetical protein
VAGKQENARARYRYCSKLVLQKRMFKVQATKNLLVRRPFVYTKEERLIFKDMGLEVFNFHSLNTYISQLKLASLTGMVIVSYEISNNVWNSNNIVYFFGDPDKALLWKLSV